MKEEQLAAQLGQHLPISVLQSEHFQMPLPAGWTDRSIYTARGHLDDGSVAAITVYAEISPKMSDLMSYVKLQKAQLAGQLLDFELTPGLDQPIVNGRTFLLDYNWTTPEKQKVRQVQMYWHSAPNIWTLTASAASDSTADLMRLIAELSSRFQIKG